MRLANEISNTLKKMKSGSSLQKKDYLAKVRLHFKIEEDENWVATKLRMMLFKEGANLELFQLHLPAKSMPERKQNEERNNQKDTALKKPSRKNISPNVPAARKQGIKKPRLSLEDKQLIKLRAVHLPQAMENPTFQVSKEEFLGGFNLVKKQILSTNSGSKSLDAKEGQKEAENMQTKSGCQIEQNIFKVNVLKALSCLNGRNQDRY